MKSLEEFVEDANMSDLKYDLLEKWISRKEREIRERDKLPPVNFNKSDKMIWEEKEKKNAERRRKALEAITKRKYEDITRSDLTLLVNKLCKRMYLFDSEYPQLIIDIVKELRVHPNITQTDKQMLETYAEIFDLNWKEGFRGTLAENPIYLDEPCLKGRMNPEDIAKEVKKASLPFASELITKMSTLI
jgi:replication initiation and membrane attachment protein DnaB